MIQSETQPVLNTSILNGLRGLAALYVLIGHARWLLWEGFSEGYKHHLGDYNLFNTCLVYLLSIFSKGHIAVMLFFVLSGFVIHYSTIKKGQRKLNLKEYFTRRFLRIYPPLLFCMVLTLLLDLCGKYIFGYSIYFHNTPILTINQSIEGHLSWQTAIGNLLMLQSVYTHVWGSNGPLWSLMYEWWFYMLYPVMFIIYSKNRLLLYLCVSLLFVAASTGVLENKLASTIFNYLLCWSLGAFLADVLLKRLNLLWLAVPLGICIIEFFAGHYYPSIYMTAIYDTLTGFIFVALIFLLLKAKSLLFTHRVLTSFDVLGDYSYTLYVIHVPILVLINGIVLNYTGNLMPANFTIMFLSIVLVLFIAYYAHFLTEIPFRKKLKPVVTPLQQTI